jgi:hypothetical protein
MTELDEVDFDGINETLLYDDSPMAMDLAPSS